MSNLPPLHINKGVELLLRKRRKEPDQPKTFKLSFSKIISLLKREMHIYFEFSFDIKKSNPSEVEQ